MYRVLLATVITVFVSQAATVTFTSCTVGTTTISPCGRGYLLPGGLPDAMAGASASDTGIIDGVPAQGNLPPITGQTLSAGVVAIAIGGSAAASATAQASAFNTFVSAGPARSGFIEFDVSLLQLHGGDSFALLTDGVHTYSYEGEFGFGSTPPTGRCFEGCQWTAIVPFDLGTDFQVSASGNDVESLEAGSTGMVAHGDDDAVVTFTLFEADRTTPVPFSVAPEPSTWGLLLFGSAACVFSSRRRRLVR